MRKNLFSVFMLSALLIACRHDDKKIITPVPDPNLTIVSKLEGVWLWEGTGKGLNLYYDNLFFPQHIRVINSRLIIKNSDTLRLQSIDENSHIMSFYFNHYNGGGSTMFSSSELIYNYATGALSSTSAFGSTYGSWEFKIHRINRNYSSAIKDHLQHIIGTKTMSGFVFDTFYNSTFHAIVDTYYSVNQPIEYSLANDSTIKIGTSILNMNFADANMLHYKASDLQNSVDTFQSYEYIGTGTARPEFSRLLYFAIGDSIIFEQRYHDGSSGGYVRLRD